MCTDEPQTDADRVIASRVYSLTTTKNLNEYNKPPPYQQHWQRLCSRRGDGEVRFPMMMIQHTVQHTEQHTVQHTVHHTVQHRVQHTVQHIQYSIQCSIQCNIQYSIQCKCATYSTAYSAAYSTTYSTAYSITYTVQHTVDPNRPKHTTAEVLGVQRALNKWPS